MVFSVLGAIDLRMIWEKQIVKEVCAQPFSLFHFPLFQDADTFASALSCTETRIWGESRISGEKTGSSHRTKVVLFFDKCIYRRLNCSVPILSFTHYPCTHTILSVIDSCEITQWLFKTFDQEESCVIKQKPVLCGENLFLPGCDHIPTTFVGAELRNCLCPLTRLTAVWLALVSSRRSHGVGVKCVTLHWYCRRTENWSAIKKNQCTGNRSQFIEEVQHQNRCKHGWWATENLYLQTGVEDKWKVQSLPNLSNHLSNCGHASKFQKCRSCLVCQQRWRPRALLGTRCEDHEGSAFRGKSLSRVTIDEKSVCGHTGASCPNFMATVEGRKWKKGI